MCVCRLECTFWAARHQLFILASKSRQMTTRKMLTIRCIFCVHVDWFSHWLTNYEFSSTQTHNYTFSSNSWILCVCFGVYFFYHTSTCKTSYFKVVFCFDWITRITYVLFVRSCICVCHHKMRTFWIWFSKSKFSNGVWGHTPKRWYSFQLTNKQRFER